MLSLYTVRPIADCGQRVPHRHHRRERLFRIEWVPGVLSVLISLLITVRRTRFVRLGSFTSLTLETGLFPRAIRTMKSVSMEIPGRCLQLFTGALSYSPIPARSSPKTLPPSLFSVLRSQILSERLT